jgi:hypothetical protein
MYASCCPRGDSGVLGAFNPAAGFSAFSPNPFPAAARVVVTKRRPVVTRVGGRTDKESRIIPRHPFDTPSAFAFTPRIRRVVAFACVGAARTIVVIIVDIFVVRSVRATDRRRGVTTKARHVKDSVPFLLEEVSRVFDPYGYFLNYKPWFRV